MSSRQGGRMSGHFAAHGEMKFERASVRLPKCLPRLSRVIRPALARPNAEGVSALNGSLHAKKQVICWNRQKSRCARTKNGAQ